jgi:DNA-binding NtrC family response regulator
MLAMSKQGNSILVVDDQESWRDLLVAILGGGDYHIVTASTFQEAKTLLMEKSFALAILDMRLVDASPYNIQGMAILEEAKRLHPSMKAIILTGYPDPHQRARALEFYGADGYFEKVPDGQPLDVNNFRQLVCSLLDEQHSSPRVGGNQNV